MKKLYSLLLALVLMLSIQPARADHYTISSKSEFTAAIGAERGAEGVDTLFIKYVEGGINTGSVNNSITCMKGTIHIIGVNDEETGARPILATDWQFGANAEADNFSVIVENMNLQYRSGATASSGQIFYVKGLRVYFQEFALRNCEITNYARTIFRSVPPQDKDGIYGDGGYINHFEISDCDVHYADISSGNTWACVVMGQPMTECILRGNVFYDLPYNKQIFGYQYVNQDSTSVESTEFAIENNIFAIATQQTNPLFGIGNFVGQMSSFSIKNNIIMRPNWENDYNLSPALDSLGQQEKVRFIRLAYGLVEAKNNIIDGDAYFEATTWEKDQQLDEDGEGAWLSADCDLGILPADAGFSWSDFADAPTGDFSIWKGHAIYTMGVDGTPMGPERLYTDSKKTKVNFSVTVEGSRSAKVTFTPQKDQYFAGDVVNVTANPNGHLNTFRGWSNGVSDFSQVLTLTEDLALVATFEEIPYVAAWNFDQLTKNNVKLSAPLAANYFLDSDTLFLSYATWDGTQYVDSLTDAIMTRNNKVEGDLRNCFFVHTDSARFATADHSDYAYITIPAAKNGMYLMASIATDNVTFKTISFDWSLDKATWTSFNTFEMTATGQWFDVAAYLPAELDGKTVYVRIKGVEESGWFISPEMQASFDAGNNHQTTEYLFVSELYLVMGEPQQPETHDDYMMVGTFQGWSFENNPVIFTYQGNNTYTASVAEIFGDWKIVKNYSWDGALAGATNIVPGQPVTLVAGGDNAAFKSGLTITNATFTLTILEDGNATFLVEGNASEQHSYGLVGAFQGWNAAGAPLFTEQADGSWTIDVTDFPGGEMFKVSIDKSWTCFLAQNDVTKLSFGKPYTCARGDNNNNFTIGESGSKYDIHAVLVVAADGQSAQLTITDQTNGIVLLQTDAPVQPIFDLQGRPVNQPTRGLYIQGEKKIMVK